jgi:hypothetical protein
LGDFDTACGGDWIGVKGKEMKRKRREFIPSSRLAVVWMLAVVFAFGIRMIAQESKPDTNTTAEKPKAQEKKDTNEGPKTKLKIVVTGDGKPVGNASVYVRFNASGGLLHKEKQMEVDLKTNENGTAKVKDLPRGKILVQVIAKGWHTFGQWYEMDSDDKTIEIKLEPPPHWY